MEQSNRASNPAGIMDKAKERIKVKNSSLITNPNRSGIVISPVNILK